ncbi:leucine-rich repeat domain-containing protein [Chloroflexota bacterium]
MLSLDAFQITGPISNINDPNNPDFDAPYPLTYIPETVPAYRNRISDISPLASLVNLIELSLTGNQVSNLEPLANLSCLTRLRLGGNQISATSTLVNLPNLDGLTCMIIILVIFNRY